MKNLLQDSYNGYHGTVNPVSDETHHRMSPHVGDELQSVFFRNIRTRWETSPSRSFMGIQTGTRTTYQERPHPPHTTPEEYEILVTPLRDDISYDNAKKEIREYIVERVDGEDLSIGAIARELRLDLNAVIEVFEELGLI